MNIKSKIYRNNIKILLNKLNLKYVGLLCIFIFIYNFKKYRFLKLKDILLRIPYLRTIILEKLKKIGKSLEDDTKSKYNNFKILPYNGLNKTEINKILDGFDQYKKDINKISGIIYLGDKNHNDNMINIFNHYSFSNPLHPDIFPEIRSMEIDIINMVKNLFAGGDECCGNVTYGGTESILLACVTYRDYFKTSKGIYNPNIVCFDSVHPAFDKASHYFNIAIRKAKNLSRLKKLIDNNTILLVGSCPEYSYGEVDPIIEMSNLALKKKIGLHIDCCMGGFLVPFLDEFKHINFNLKTITSISADTHKYGYSLKGSSILLFRNYDIKKFQHFINKDWIGGVYATPTMMGSKSGGIIAATWFSLINIGYQKYKEYANEIRNNLIYIRDRISKLETIEVIGDPRINIIAFKTTKTSIYQLINQMQNRGWNLTIMQNPSSFHLCITKMHTREKCDEFCRDIEESLEYLKNKENEKLTGTLALYGTSSNLENSFFIEEVIHDFLFLLSRNDCISRYI